MSRWSEKLENHDVHAIIGEIRDLAEKQPDNIPPDGISESRRFLKVLSSIESAISNLDPDEAPFNAIDNINSHLRNGVIVNEYNAYLSNGNIQHLINANDHLDGVVPQITALRAQGAKATGLLDLTEELENISQSFVDSVAKKRDELNSSLSKLQENMTGANSKLTELSDLVEQRRQEVDARLSEWQKQFSESQDSRSSQFNSWYSAFTTESDSEIEKFIENRNEFVSSENQEFRNTINEIIDDAVLKHQKILELYELTATDSVGASYQKTAIDEKRTADRLRFVSFCFIGATIGWLLYSAWSHSDSGAAGIDWLGALKTIGLTATLLFGAVYAAQQSTKHRSNELRTRWFALEVGAIDPFSNSLTPEQQQVLKVALAERLFGQVHSVADEARNSSEKNPSTHLLETAINLVNKIKPGQS